VTKPTNSNKAFSSAHLKKIEIGERSKDAFQTISQGQNFYFVHAENSVSNLIAESPNMAALHPVFSFDYAVGFD
jgi:hypothetical protein